MLPSKAQRCESGKHLSRYQCLIALHHVAWQARLTIHLLMWQEGTIDILDVGASERLESVAAHSGPVWSLAALPDGSGFVSGSADHDVKFWEWEIVTETTEGGSGCVGCTLDTSGAWW